MGKKKKKKWQARAEMLAAIGTFLGGIGSMVAAIIEALKD